MSREADIVMDSQKMFDEVWSRALKQSAANGMPMTCGKGCSACCSEPVYVNAAEARLMLANLPEPERAGVAERTSQWATRLKASGLLKEKQPHVLKWLRVNAPCPFLKDGLCLVYQHRPLGCRYHTAVGPKELCFSTGTRFKQRYMMVEQITGAVSMKMLHADTEHDHLGAFLTRLVLNEPIESAAQVKFEIR